INPDQPLLPAQFDYPFADRTAGADPAPGQLLGQAAGAEQQASAQAGKGMFKAHRGLAPSIDEYRRSAAPAAVRSDQERRPAVPAGRWPDPVWDLTLGPAPRAGSPVTAAGHPAASGPAHPA